MRAIGFNAGQFGDVLMGTVAARAFKEQNPDSHLTLGIAEKYSSIAPLFRGHKYFDALHIWKGYNDWPNKDDELHLALKRYDKVFDAMPQHTDPFWYLQRHQTAELCMMHGLTPPKNLQVDLTEIKGAAFAASKTIALSLFGETRGGDKNVTEEQAKQIVELVKKMGYNPMQLGVQAHPKICDGFLDVSFESSVIFMRMSKMLITVDTAMSWIASGYSHPTIGLYCSSYYPMATTSKNWQPVNPNAIYLESPKVSDIILDRIETSIKSLS